MAEDSQKKVLLIKLSSLGDIIFNIPLANSIKNSGYNVDWLVSEKGIDVLTGNPCINNLIIAPFGKLKKQKGLIERLKNITEMISLIKKIRQNKYDIVIDTQGRWKSLIFTLFCGAKRRIIGSDFQEFSNFGANEIVKVPAKNDASLNIVDKYLLFAKHLGISTENAHMTLPETSSEIKEKVDNLLNFDENKPLAVVAPTTTWETKHWDKENWKSLIKKLSERCNIVLTGTDKDYDYIEYINSSLGLNLAGKTDLKMLVEIFRRADIVLSLDSGSTHLARAARAKSIVSIFCSTPAKLYEPLGENYKSLQGNLPCQPCHKRKCPKSNNECTKMPDVSEVYDTVCNFLNQNNM